jgi:hypothetical protein
VITPYNKLVKFIQNIASRFFARGEQFLVAEIVGGRVYITQAQADFEKKAFILTKTVTGLYPAQKPMTAIPILRNLLKSFSSITGCKVIISLGSELGTTLHSTIALTRDNAKQPIDESDLDNRVAQGMWKVFDRERGQAAKKMHIDDLEVLLTDVRIKSIRLDGHKVINPIGFSAETIELHFNQTFLPQRFAAELRASFIGVEIVLMAESGVIHSDMLTKLGFPKTFMFAEITPHETRAFLVKDENISYVDTVPWGRQHIPHALGNGFSVEKRVAENLLDAYRIRRASHVALKRIEKAILSEVETFVDYLSPLLAGQKLKTVFVSGGSEIPEMVFGRSFSAQRGKVKFTPVSFDIFEKKLGFTSVLKRDVPESIAFSALSVVLEFYFLKRDDKINRIAKRHARWLIN